MPRALPFLIASTALACASAPAFADPNVTVRSEVVRYGDLNLNDTYQTDELIGRIQTAARHVCDDPPGPTTLSNHREERTCRDDSETRAVADTGDSRVIGRYYGRTPEVIVSENEYGTTTVYKK